MARQEAAWEAASLSKLVPFHRVARARCEAVTTPQGGCYGGGAMAAPPQAPRSHQTSPRRSRVGTSLPARAVKMDWVRVAGPARLPGHLPSLPRRELLTKSNDKVDPLQRGRAAFTSQRTSRLPPATKGHVRSWKGNLVLSEDTAWLLSPRTARNEGPANVLLHHLTLGEEHIVGLLRKLEWFSVLPERDLKRLYQRGRHRAFPRYSAIIREGASCDALHILLHGQLKFVSASQSTVIKNAGAFFGESALVARAQPMDAAVYAETDCFVLQLSRSNVEGLSVDADLFDLRSRVASQLLVEAHFFRYLTKDQLGGVARLMDIATLSSGEHVFHEGDPGTALYVLSQGRVEVYRRRTAAGEPMEHSSGSRPAPLAVHTASSHNPWFGELALWKSRPRAASAVCTELTRVLILRSADFSAFLDIVPTFAVACSAAQNAYWALEHVCAAYHASDAMPQGRGLTGPLAVVGRWERLATALLQAQLPREAVVKTPDSWLRDPYAGVGW